MIWNEDRRALARLRKRARSDLRIYERVLNHLHGATEGLDSGDAARAYSELKRTGHILQFMREHELAAELTVSAARAVSEGNAPWAHRPVSLLSRAINQARTRELAVLASTTHLLRQRRVPS
jgi:hypothetical protein